MRLTDALAPRWLAALVVLEAASLAGAGEVVAALAVCSLYLAWRLRNHPAERTRLALTLAAGCTTDITTTHHALLTAAMSLTILAIACAIAAPASGRTWAVGAAIAGALPMAAALASPVAGAITLMVYATATTWATTFDTSPAPLTVLPAAACGMVCVLAAVADLPHVPTWVLAVGATTFAWLALMVVTAASLPEDTWEAARRKHAKENTDAAR